jgi:hypothetical protein
VLLTLSLKPLPQAEAALVEADSKMPWVIVVGLMTWLAVTVAAQAAHCGLGRWRPSHRSGILPRWTFFAPYPEVRDYRLFVRARPANGPFGSWREIPLADVRFPLSSVWNPRKRIQKGLYFALSSLLALKRQTAQDRLVQTEAYRRVLGYVRETRLSPESREVQFMIARSYGFVSSLKPKSVFLSEIHPLS